MNGPKVAPKEIYQEMNIQEPTPSEAMTCQTFNEVVKKWKADIEKVVVESILLKTKNSCLKSVLTQKNRPETPVRESFAGNLEYFKAIEAYCAKMLSLSGKLQVSTLKEINKQIFQNPNLPTLKRWMVGYDHKIGVPVKECPDGDVEDIVEMKNREIDQYVEDLKQGKWKIEFDDVIKNFKETARYKYKVGRPATPELMNIDSFEEAEDQLENWRITEGAFDMSEELKAIIVFECVEKLVAPKVLSDYYNATLDFNPFKTLLVKWVKESGKTMPLQFKICTIEQYNKQ